jgi:hypothetical protein
MSSSDLEAYSRSYATVLFIDIGWVKVEGEMAEVQIGVDIITRDRQPKRCCCSGTASFAQTPEGWTFVRWGLGVCA